MKLKYIYTGSWFPRTKLHLRELYNFLKEGQSLLAGEKERLSKLVADMGIKDVTYKGGLFDKVTAHAGPVQIEYEEDGLLLLRVEPKNWPSDSIILEEFYQEKFTPFLYLLFSKGAPSLEVVRTGLRRRPIIAVAKEATQDDIRVFFAGIADKVHDQVEKKDASVYFGDHMILIVSPNPDSILVSYLTHFYAFFREYEAYLYHFLLIDRTIWDSINEIRAYRTIRGRDLSQIRDQLLLFKRDVGVIKLRLSQMDNYLDERLYDIQDRKLQKKLEMFKAFRFEKMASIHEYVSELMETTDKYVEDAVDLLELLYEENQQKELGTLQVIFLIGTVANVIVLGQNATLNMSRLFGLGSISVVVSFFFYLLWHYIFKRIRLNRAVSMLEKQMKDKHPDW